MNAAPAPATRLTRLIVDPALAADRVLQRVSRPGRVAVITLTLAVMVAVGLPNVPRAYLDLSRVPLIGNVQQPETFGTDTIADMYESKVVLHDVADMYTKAELPQTPLEAETWSREASAPYPPAVLLAEAALYVAGERTGLGFYGMVLLLACTFIGLSLWYCLQTRWYLFPLLYLNFGYFGRRFVYVQDGSYLVMLVVVMAALLLARRGRRTACHALMALAVTMKLSPLYYVRHVPRMRRPAAVLFVGILLAGLVLPYFLWDHYLYIFTFNDTIKGRSYSGIAALALVIPFSLLLWYVETRLDVDWEDRVGWGLVPFALFLGFKMNVARHLLIVLLVPDKRGVRNLAAAIGLAVPAALPGLVRFNSALPIATLVLIAGLVCRLEQIGWTVVRADLRHPLRTARMLLRMG